MNTRAPGRRPSRCLVPALLVAVAALTFPCATTEAGCGSHDGRPTVALEWAGLTPSTPADRPPVCLGLNCSRTSLPPVVAPPAPPPPHADILDGSTPEPFSGRRPRFRIERFDGLIPIGRKTEIERPPCRLAIGE